MADTAAGSAGGLRRLEPIAGTSFCAPGRGLFWFHSDKIGRTWKIKNNNNKGYNFMVK